MPLAKPGEPYVTGRGKVLVSNDRGGEPIETAISPSDPILGAGTARNHTPSERRSITDLPAEPKTETAIVVVLFYSLFGLSDNEIAHTVGIEVSQVKKLKGLDAYQETYDILFWEMIHANSQSMVAKIAKFAPTALDGVMKVAGLNPDDEKNNQNAILKANQDILDRSGLHHETLFGKAASDGVDGLKIIIKGADDDKTEVNINVGGRRL